MIFKGQYVQKVRKSGNELLKENKNIKNHLIYRVR